MANPAGEPVDGPLRLGFDRRLKLGFHGSGITTDAGWPACRGLDDVLGLTDMAGHEPVDPRTGKDGRHAMTGLFRRSVFGRLGGHEDVNDADRPGCDPAMRWIVGGRAVAGQAMVADRREGEADQDRRRDRHTRPVCHVPVVMQSGKNHGRGVS